MWSFHQMKFCFHIKRRLSAYCEGELSAGERARIQAHIERCADCHRCLEQIRKNSRLMRQMPIQEPGDELWYAIARDLSSGRSPEPARDVPSGRWLGFSKRRLMRPAAIAIALALITTAMLLASQYGLLPGGHRGELNLAGYLDLVGDVAAAEPALREFPPAPGFTTVNWPEARATIGFPVIAPEILPGGYRLTSVRLYTHGGLRALQFKYRGEQGGLCVFQLPARSKLSFGEQPSEQYQSDGVQCRLLRSQHCSVYPFVLGETQCALMTRQTDPATVDALIQFFNAEYKKTH
jgi:hypothetical protein